jgi:hypothetical protein
MAAIWGRRGEGNPKSEAGKAVIYGPARQTWEKQFNRRERKDRRENQ